MQSYRVIKDTREKDGWTFTEYDKCEGMDMGALAHGVAVRWLRLYTGWYSPSLYIYSCNTTSNTSWTRTLKRSE